MTPHRCHAETADASRVFLYRRSLPRYAGDSPDNPTSGRDRGLPLFTTDLAIAAQYNPHSCVGQAERRDKPDKKDGWVRIAPVVAQ